jgi:hypothetical protein
MINADMRPYTFFTVGTASGIPTVSEEPAGTLRMSIYNVSNAIADNIRYKDATYIGLTMDAEVDDTYIIDNYGAKLKVLYVMPKGRYKQVWMAEL